MEPTISPINSEPPQNQQNSFGSEPEPEIIPKHSRKKLFITIGVIVTVLIIAGAGISVWAMIDRNNRLAETAKLEAAQRAKADAEAKARQGTVSEIEIVLNEEFKKTQELHDRSVFSQKDGLEQETNAAITIGTGNDSGI